MSTTTVSLDINKQNKKHGNFSANLITNVGNYSLTLLIGVWFVPYLIKHLGAAAYGILPLALQFTSYMSVITMGLNAAVGRYLTVHLERNEQESANKVFNTSFFGSIILVLVLAAPAYFMARNVTVFFNVPKNIIVDAQLLFICTMTAFFLNEIKTPFDVSTFCRNRFDLRNMVAVGETIIRVSLVVLLFSAIKPRLWYVGLGLIAAACFSFTCAIFLWRRLTPTLSVKLRDFDRTALKGLTTIGGWSIINQLSTMLFVNIDLMVANKMLGAVPAGQYAAAIQWSTILRGLATAFTTIYTPTIVMMYAKHDLDGIVYYARNAVRFTGAVMALLIGLVCGFSTVILKIWLGPGFSHLGMLMSLLTIHLCVSLAYLPLHGIMAAANKVQLPGIVSLTLGIFNVILAVLLCGPAHWGMYGIAAAGAVTLTIKNSLFTPIYAAKVLNKPGNVFLTLLPMPVVSTLVVILICRLIMASITINHFSQLFLWGCIISLLYIIFAVCILLKSSERQSIIDKLRTFRNKRTSNAGS